MARAYLEREGFIVDSATDGASALELIERKPPELIVLDLMLPDVSGEQIATRVRARSDVPILMLTAKVSEQQRLAGFALGEKFRALAGEFNERQRRLWAASEARAAGRGGIAATSRATGISAPTIRKGIAELQPGEHLDAGRVRKPGGGRHALTELDSTLLEDLELLVRASVRGDPESLLLWTSKSVRHLAGALRVQGHTVHFTTVAKLLGLLGYSLQADVKTREGASNPDRDAQFEHINAVARVAIAAGRPVISVDTKKKEAGRGLQERQPRVAAQGRA